jgi:hypothetical protein
MASDAFGEESVLAKVARPGGLELLIFCIAVPIKIVTWFVT